MRCIKINMVYPPMHHFLNVSGFLCFFLAPLSSLFNLSHFQRTVQEAITGRPQSPPPPRLPPRRPGDVALPSGWLHGLVPCCHQGLDRT